MKIVADWNSGVYMIRNLVTGKVYVGSAVKLRKRANEHHSTLVANTHFNRRLQNSWNKHGPDAFEFVVLELVQDLGQLTSVEQRHIDERQSFVNGVGYNLRPKADSNLGLKMPPHVIEIIRRTHTGRKHSPETIAKRMASQIASGGRERMRLAHLGKKQSAELVAKRMAAAVASGAREIARIASIGRKSSAETRAKQSASLTGRKMSPEAVRKSAEKRTGQLRPDVAKWAPAKFAMFKPEQVTAMRNDRKLGMTYRVLADKHGCSVGTAHFVVNGTGSFYSECA
ncbi:MAG: hypothetical protein JWO52_4037 [Gammaproteobacteria bacterium]|nr:hypothetical protein [Gammaproteobacteria bacterium]